MPLHKTKAFKLKQNSTESVKDAAAFTNSAEIIPDDSTEIFHLKRNLGLPGSVALITGTIVGSGIFSSPGGVLEGVNNSVGMSLVVWAACGGVSSLAALCYCELGSMFLDSGGNYTYFLKGYGKLGRILGFTYAYATMTILQPSSNAIKCLVFGSYVVAPFFSGDCQPSDVITKSTAVSALLFVATINYLDVKSTSKVMSTLTIAKFLGMAIIIVGGFVRLAQGDRVGSQNFSNSFLAKDLAGLGFTQIGLAFYQGLWSYDGYQNLNVLAEEVKDSKRVIPLALIIALPLVTLFYILVNVAYFSVLTPEEILTSDAVAITWVYRVIGNFGWIMSLVVGLSTLGSLNGGFLSKARIGYAAAKKGHLPQILGMVTVDHCTPGAAVIWFTIMTIVFLIPNDFQTLVNAFNFSSWMFQGLVILSVVIMRFTYKDHPRPYKVPLLIPILGFIISVYLVIAPLVEDPDITLLYAAAFLLAGPLLYFLFVYKKLKMPGMDHFTIFLQSLLNAAPEESKEEN